MNRKKLLILTIFILSLLFFKSVDAQITLDTILPPLAAGLGLDFKIVQISNTETKYFFADTVANTFSLYNMDFTPFILNIAVPEPFAIQTLAFQVLYLSRGLFDCDTSNIEYAYYSPLSYTTPFRIVRTDGTILFQQDSVVGPYAYGLNLGGTDVIRPIVNTSSGARMILIGYSGQIYIYSLCGAFTTDFFDNAIQNKSYVTVFPNPTSHILTFHINVPDNMNIYELVIVAGNAKEISRNKINLQNNNVIINVENYSNGTYYYSLCTKEKSYQTGKFIISK
jgi:hypothetical protein